MRDLKPDIEKIRQITGSSIVMVKRGTQSITDFSSDFQIEENDELIIAVSNDTINKFRTYYCYNTPLSKLLNIHPGMSQTFRSINRSRY